MAGKPFKLLAKTAMLTLVNTLMMESLLRA
jgi:hypothetical protein